MAVRTSNLNLVIHLLTIHLVTNTDLGKCYDFTRPLTACFIKIFNIILVALVFQYFTKC
jgi:hypothetical protein